MDLKNNLIEFLNYSGTLGDLEKKGVKVSRDFNYPGLYNLKYQSILVDKSDPLVCACRGAVVERVDNDGDHSPYYRLVAYAFDRFFNIGESHCHQLDWSRTKIYEKYDGSLIKLFNYNGDWIVSTSGSVAAASEVGSTGRSFAELFWLVFDEVGYSTDMLDSNLCYIFELCHRDNRIVVDYAEPQLPLLAVRDRNQDLEELKLVEFCNLFGFNAAQSYDFGSMEGLMAVVNDRGADHEGFILFDGVGRAKAKSDVYCQMHRVRGNGDPNFSELFLNDDLEEFLLHFPEYREGFDVHLRSIDMMEVAVESMMSAHNHLNQKDFALVVLDEGGSLSGACFVLRSGKVGSFGEWLEGLTPKKLDALLGIA
jgi:hypothetical protein